MKLREIMSTIVSEYLNEATVQNDKYYYDIADDFYNKMVVELNNNNFINQVDGNILFKGSKINKTYSDLLIVFTTKNTQKTKPTFGGDTVKGGYALGTYKQYKVIIVNNLKDKKIPSKGIIKTSFIHEFIHYLDFKRSKVFKPNFNEKTSLVDYYNHPTEYNAYFQEAATYIVNLFKDDNVLNKFKEDFPTFDGFLNWMLGNVFNKDFVKNLNDKNKIKITKRVYNIYSEFLEKMTNENDQLNEIENLNNEKKIYSNRQ